MTLIIQTDITDWEEELIETEPDLTKNPIIDLQIAGMKPAQVARLLIAGRERGDVKEDILPANKILLMGGGAVHVSRVTAQEMIKVNVGDNSFQARAYVAPVNEEEGEGDDPPKNDTLLQGVSLSPDFLTTVKGDKALDYAQKYLNVKIPGYIWGRLLIIATNGGDVKAVAKQLKADIDAMVKELGG